MSHQSLPEEGTRGAGMRMEVEEGRGGYRGALAFFPNGQGQARQGVFQGPGTGLGGSDFGAYGRGGQSDQSSQGHSGTWGQRMPMKDNTWASAPSQYGTPGTLGSQGLSRTPSQTQSGAHQSYEDSFGNSGTSGHLPATQVFTAISPGVTQNNTQGSAQSHGAAGGQQGSQRPSMAPSQGTQGSTQAALPGQGFEDDLFNGGMTVDGQGWEDGLFDTFINPHPYGNSKS